MRFRTFLFVVIAAAYVSAQPPPDPELAAVIGLARSAPPEFASDALITLAQSGRVSSPNEKIALLRDAFELAAAAQEPVALTLVYGGGVYQPVSRAFGLGMDQVSLRARAVKAMLTLDGKQARELFDRVHVSVPSASGCDAQYIPDPSLYYSVMTEVLNSLPAPGDREAALNSRFGEFTSATQIRPLVGVFLALKDGPEAAAGAAFILAEKLQGLKADSATVFSSTVMDPIGAIAKLAERLPPAARKNLIEHARRWVLAVTANGLCQGRRLTVMRADRKQEIVPWLTPVERFNRDLAPLAPDETIKPDAVPSGSTEPAPPLSHYSDAYNSLNKEFSAIANDGSKDSLVWKDEIETFITKVSDWDDTSDGADDSRNGFFLEKVSLFQTILRLQARSSLDLAAAKTQAEYAKLAAGPKAEFLGRDRAQRAFMAFLESSTAAKVYNKRRIIWYTGFVNVLKTYDKAEEPASMLSAFATSRDPALMLSGRLYKLLAK